jgi:hypothetical protein
MGSASRKNLRDPIVVSLPGNDQVVKLQLAMPYSTTKNQCRLRAAFLFDISMDSKYEFYGQLRRLLRSGSEPFAMITDT